MFIRIIMTIVLVALPSFFPLNPDLIFKADEYRLHQNKKDVITTPEQIEKLHQAEIAADHFVKRWRETLDMNILFEELYVTDPDRRKRNILLYCGKCLEESGKIDDDTLKRAFLGFWNMYYLGWEYSLAFDKPEKDEPPAPPGIGAIEKMFAKINKTYGENGPQQGQIKEHTLALIGAFETASDLYRQHLPKGWFKSLRYKRNYQREYAKEDRSKVLDGDLSNFPTKPGEVVYLVQRGTFELYFVEEAGRFKVLTIGYEL